jgi:fluoride exporter
MNLFNIILVSLGGAFGSILRLLLSTTSIPFLSQFFPTSILLINVLGSFGIGLLFPFYEAGKISSNVWLFIAIGILGGFTTFSTFSLEALKLCAQHEYGPAIAYVALSVVGGILACFCGYFLARGVA